MLFASIAAGGSLIEVFPDIFGLTPAFCRNEAGDYVEFARRGSAKGIHCAHD